MRPIAVSKTRAENHQLNWLWKKVSLPYDFEIFIYIFKSFKLFIEETYSEFYSTGSKKIINLINLQGGVAKRGNLKILKF